MVEDPTDALRTPVTVLTGFLGAGKTTILNSLLSACGPMTIAVIENEFGDIGIDNQLVTGAEERLVELANGCLCCTVRGDIIRILHKWLDEGVAMDRIVIETTGIADPGPIVETFAADRRIARHFAIDGIVTVVDAVNVEAQLQECDEARQQIAYADSLIINKAESCGSARLLRVEQLLTQLNPLASQSASRNGQVTAAAIFGTARSDALRPLALPDNGHRHRDISSVSFDIAGELNAPRFYRWLGDLLAFRSSQLYRMKGILSIEGLEERLIVQGVRDQITFTLMPGACDERRCQLVFIGRGIDTLRDDAELQDCFSNKIIA